MYSEIVREPQFYFDPKGQFYPNIWITYILYFIQNVLLSSSKHFMLVEDWENPAIDIKRLFLKKSLYHCSLELYCNNR